MPPEFDVTGNTFEVSGSKEASSWPPARVRGAPQGLRGALSPLLLGSGNSVCLAAGSSLCAWHVV